MRFLFLICTLFICSTVGAEDIVVTTQGSPQSRSAGYIIAKKLGFYKELGLNVKFNYTYSDENVMALLSSKQSQFITMPLIQGLSNRLNGYKVVNVMQTSHASSMCVVSHIPFDNANGLRTKRIALWSSLDPFILKLFYPSRNISKYEIIYYDKGVNLFLSGAVDMMIARSYDELIQLRQCGFKLTPKNIIYFKSRGYDIPEDGIYVTEDYIKSNKATIKKFVEASIKGWQWVRTHPNEAMTIITREALANKISTNHFVQTQMLQEVMRLQRYNPKSRDNYTLLFDEFERAKKIFKNNPTIQHLNYKDFMYNPSDITK